MRRWSWRWPGSFQLQQVGQHVGLFSGGAFAAEHVFAVAAEPLVHLGLVGEGFGVEGRSQRRNGLAGAGVLAFGGGWGVVATGAAPLAAVLGVEQLLATFGLTRAACLGTPALELGTGRGVGSSCLGGGKRQAQRQHTGGGEGGKNGGRSGNGCHARSLLSGA